MERATTINKEVVLEVNKKTLLMPFIVYIVILLFLAGWLLVFYSEPKEEKKL